jgi:reactive intermediate/imine deaminase
MDKTVIEIPVFSESIRRLGVPLSPVVKANGFLFVSGMPPLEPKTGALIKGDIETQARGALEAIRHVLEGAGSSLEKVVKVTVYVTNVAWFSRFNTIYAEYFRTAPPARTFVTVGSWPFEFDIEIECIALA